MDMNASPAPRHSRTVMLLHWLIAISVIVNWRLVEAREHASKAEKGVLMDTHFALGIVILVLGVIMIVRKLSGTTPPLASHLKKWEVAMAKSTHGLLYLLLIVMPILGWVAKSSFGQGIDMFGLFTWPPLPIGKNPDLGGALFDIHGGLGIAMVVLIGLHMLGALKHTLIDRDGNLFRMLPFGQPKA